MEGLLFEDPAGTSFPPLLAAKPRFIMDFFGFDDAIIGVHVHYGYSLAEFAVLECLSAGINAI